MSGLKLLLAPNENTKPWLKIFVDTITARAANFTGQFSVQDLQVNGNLQVAGFINSTSTQETVGSLMSTTDFPTGYALPVGTGGTIYTFSTTLNKIVVSGLSGANTAFQTADSVTGVQLLTPFSNPAIVWSPTLALFSGVDGAGTAVYTSPSGNNGTWVLGTPAATAFSVNSAIWNSVFGRFYFPNSDPINTIFSSLNGSVYSPIPFTRVVQDFAYAPSGLGTGSGRLVCVGDNGSGYSDDGKSFTNGNTGISMEAVVWSSYWKAFIALPRNGDRTRVYRSVDGINWTTPSAPFAAGVNLRSIVWADALGVFIAAGDASTFWISKDGITWRQIARQVAGLSSYGGAYIQEWGVFNFSGLGGFMASQPRRYIL